MAFKPQRVVILAGLPASGKTTLATRLRELGFAWINQDVMGTRRDCEKAFTAELYAGRDIVVDRCNFDQAQRSTWLQYARGYGAECIGVQIMIPVELCIERALARKDHPTLGTKESIHTVIPRFANDFRTMHPAEGFSCIFTVTQQHDIERFMRFIAPAHNDAHHRSASGALGAAQRHPSQSPSTAQHASHQPQFQSREPQQGQPWPPQVHASSTFRSLRGGGYDMSQHGNGTPALQAGSQWQSASSAAQQPSSNGRQHGEAVTDDDQTPPPQKKPKKKQKKAAGTGDESNIVPFAVPVKQDGMWSSARKLHDAPAVAQRFLDVTAGPPGDMRPILLFDLNGTLTTHTAQRRSAGVNLVRPGVHHLMQLQEVFRLGVWSSASQRTINSVIPMLEEAASPGKDSPEARLLPFQQLIMSRGHTVAAPTHHVENGGKAWDTVKPLHTWFKDLRKVILVDDDAFKADVGEEANMINIPRWEEDPDDTVLRTLTTTLLKEVRKMGDLGNADLRLCTEHVTQLLQLHAGKRAASEPAPERRVAMRPTHDNEEDMGEDCKPMDVAHARKMLEKHSDFWQAVGA